MLTRALLFAIFTVQLSCTPLLAQMSTSTMPTPGVPATSPSLFVLTPGASITLPGIPNGPTQLAPELSSTIGAATPMPGTGMPGNGTTCTNGSPGLTLLQSRASGLSAYNGSGTFLEATPSSMSSTIVCTFGLGNSGPPSTSTSTLPGGRISPIGTALGSAGIGNAGVNPLIITPTPTITPPRVPLFLLNSSSMVQKTIR
jgi:hypothetical protein